MIADKGQRLIPLDSLRGLIMVLMAVDHANFFVSRTHPTGEFWGIPLPQYESSLSFLTRFITHFSAPGFFLLRGAGMILFAEHPSSGKLRLDGFSEPDEVSSRPRLSISHAGVNLFLLYLFSLAGNRIQKTGNPLLVFGRTPLFFYLLHFYIYGAMGLPFTPRGGSGIPLMYLFWLLGLFVLYPPCLYYGKFKQKRASLPSCDSYNFADSTAQATKTTEMMIWFSEVEIASPG
jgi:hypothetical protein